MNEIENIEAIERLKKERNAIILAHNYMTPDIYHGVADIKGDSLALAIEATKVKEDVIVLAGVHFMAETAKLLNPSKTVLHPDLTAGCSLAEGITGRDVELLRQKYPGIPIVTYVNTSAEVKAHSDICCTSGNALEIVESLDSDRVIMIPDQYLAKWVATQTKKEIIYWNGSCEVHERFTGKELRDYRRDLKGLVIIAHPECPEDVLEEADFVGSTAKMSAYVKNKNPAMVLMVTECSMSDNLAIENPETKFVRPCNLCPHMKKITLDNIREALENMSPQIVIAEAIRGNARLSVERMIDLGKTHKCNVFYKANGSGAPRIR
jgi:quinolinate synthase